MGKTPFAKSSPKTALIQRLALYGPNGDTIYRLLYNEAEHGRDRLSSDYNSLTKTSMKQGVQAPYKWDDLSETARHREILNIVRTASVYTRPYYQTGQWMTTEEENWVAEWFLWHSFRFRDNRNTQPALPNSTDGLASAGSGPGQGGKLPYERSSRDKARLTLAQVHQPPRTGTRSSNDAKNLRPVHDARMDAFTATS